MRYLEGMAHKFQISGKIFSWPRQCACCLSGSPDTTFRVSSSKTTGKRVKTTISRSWDIPYCSVCVHHVTKYNSSSTWLLVGGVIGALFAVVLISRGAGLLLGALVFGLSFILGNIPFKRARERARQQMKTNCISPFCSVDYSGWHGSVETFVFHNIEYLKAFVESNSNKMHSDIPGFVEGKVSSRQIARISKN